MRTIVSVSSIAVLFVLAACGPSEPPAPAGPALPVAYPASERIDHVDNYHGVEVADPYRWLEDLEGGETAAWIEGQNAVADPFLAAIPVREKIRERLTELWNYERYKLPAKEGGRYFWRRNDGLQDQDVLYVADALDAEPRILIDPNTFSDDKTSSLYSYVPSPDGRWMAYAVSEGGSDWRTWHIRDIETGEDLPEVLEGIKFSEASWTPDGEGFYYSRYPVGDDDRADDSRQVSIFHHALDTPQSADTDVFSITDHDRRDPYGAVTDDGRYLVMGIFEGFTTNGVYYIDLSEPGSEAVRLLDRWDALYDFLGNDDETFYFSTNRDAPNYRVIAVDIRSPAPESWTEIVAEADEVLEDASVVGGHLVASYLEDAKSLVKVFDLEGSEIRQVELPGIGSAGGFNGRLDDPETFYGFDSFTNPGQIYSYDVATGSSELFRQFEVPIDLDQFETEQVFFESRDGTQMPMFLIHKKGLERNGRNPTLLYSYGGFNSSITPSYYTRRIVWLEMGGLLAIPNIRGGGEYGEEWHQAGTKLLKQNVFDDFIAAAEWLIANDYTSPEKLAIRGGSNGGLLVGATLNQRPDLFAAALPLVGVMDMLRYHEASANARQWSSDYGLSENEDEFHALRAYSPYHNTQEGTCYPPTLVLTADHDNRVVPWHSFKYAAAMQHAQGCENPILIRVETRAGHGAGKPTWMRIEEVANQWAFLAWALGME